MCSMHNGSYLKWERKVDYVFFSWWTAESEGAFWGSVVLIFLLCFVYEGYIAMRTIVEDHISTRLDAESNCYELKRSKRMYYHFLKAAIYAFQTFYAFTLMMIFMSYNGFFIVSMTLGFFGGHLAISMMRPTGKSIQASTPCH